MRPQWRGRGLTRNANRGARRRATLARCTAFAGVRGGTSHAKRGPAPPTRPPRAARGAKPWRNSSRDAPGQSERREPTGARGLADGRPQAGRSADCGPAIPQLGGRGQRARVRAWDDRRPSERRRRVRLISHRARPCRYLPSLPGARKTELTGYIEPCDPTLRDQAPRGDDWVYEIKADGYRAQVHLSGGRVTVYSRRGLDWTRQFSAIADVADDQQLDLVVARRRRSSCPRRADHLVRALGSATAAAQVRRHELRLMLKALRWDPKTAPAPQRRAVLALVRRR